MRQADEVRRLIGSLNQRRQRGESDRPALTSESEVGGNLAGQAQPGSPVGPELLRRLAEMVNVAPQDRQRLLADMGITQAPANRSGTDDVAALPASLLRLLYSHEPFLAYVVDPQWNLLASNYMLELLVGPVAPVLLVPPINVLRLVLHPDGMAARLANLTEVHGHLLRRLRRQISVGSTEPLVRLEREVAGYRTMAEDAAAVSEIGPIAMPVRLWVGSTLVNLISTAVFFGTPWEGSTTAATAECLFPADEATRKFLFACPTGLHT